MRDFLGIGVGDCINSAATSAFMRRVQDEHHLVRVTSPLASEVGDVRHEYLPDRDVERGLDTERLKADPVGVADPIPRPPPGHGNCAAGGGPA